MKLSASAMCFAFGGLLALGGILFLSTSIHDRAVPTATPGQGHLGVVMGRDFTSLLADPGVRLSVQLNGDSVSFTWRAESPSRLEDILALGRYMEGTKYKLEQDNSVILPDDERLATSIAPH